MFSMYEPAAETAIGRGLLGREYVKKLDDKAGASPADGKAWLEGLVTSHRYLEDIWASSVPVSSDDQWDLSGIHAKRVCLQKRSTNALRFA
jgi:hypothetical protein